MLRLSNLPGPQQPIRLAGELVDSIYVLPICYYGIFVTATSYNGLITLTAAVDDGCHPSARQLAERWAPAFDQLFEEVVGVRADSLCARYQGSVAKGVPPGQRAHVIAHHGCPPAAHASRHHHRLSLRARPVPCSHMRMLNTALPRATRWAQTARGDVAVFLGLAASDRSSA